MSNGPLPTRLVFLSTLPTVHLGSKVRFLGCVTKYTLSTGILTLQHAYHPHFATNVIALVDVSLLLENMKREDLEVGAWVNVLGYCEGVVEKRLHMKDQKGRDDDAGRVQVKVKAVMLWNAGGVKIGEYERVLAERVANENDCG